MGRLLLLVLIEKQSDERNQHTAEAEQHGKQLKQLGIGNVTHAIIPLSSDSGARSKTNVDPCKIRGRSRLPFVVVCLAVMIAEFVVNVNGCRAVDKPRRVRYTGNRKEAYR